MAEEAQPNSSTPSVAGESSSQTQATEAGVHSSSNAAPQTFAPTYHSLLAPSQNQEQNNHGQGLYAVQFSPVMGMMPECAPGMLIPLTYKIPTRTNSTGVGGEGQGHDAARRQNGPQRQIVVRRFQFAFQLDLALLLKLAFAVILFGQEGSRQRFVVLVFFASLIYLYQTGVMTPFIRYLQRGLVPRPAARRQNAAAAAAAVAQNDGNNDHQHDNAVNENENQNQNQNQNENENENENAAEAAPAAGNNQEPQAPEAVAVAANGGGMNLWGIAREVQTFVVGFITSLLPGFDHHHND